MSISSRITSMEEHVTNAYNGLQGLGADLTGIDKNIDNIAQVLEDIYDDLPKVTGSGTTVTLEDTRKGKIKSTLKGNTSQTGTPTPSSPIPVNVVSGDNEIQIWGESLAGNDDQQYRVNLKAGDKIKIINKSGSMVLNMYTNFGDTIRNDYWGITGDTTRIVTVGHDTNAIAWSVQPPEGNQVIKLDSIDTYNIDLGVENLWDTSKLQSGYLNQSGSYPTTNPSFPNARYRLVYLYKGQSITTYRSTSYGDFRMRYIDVDTNLIVGTVGVGDNGGYCSSNVTYQGSFNNGTITALKDVILGLFDYGGNMAEATITYGTKIQAISPTPIELCKIGNYQDYFYKDSGKWYLHKEIGKVVLNGSESWAYALQANVSRFDTVITNATKGSATNNPILSTHFKSEFALTNGRVFLSGSGNTIAIMDNDFSNTNDFKNWLSNNNVTCLYAYTTPTTEPVTYQPLIDQLNLLEKAMSKDGQTNISQVNNDLPFIISASALKEWSV